MEIKTIVADDNFELEERLLAAESLGWVRYGKSHLVQTRPDANGVQYQTVEQSVVKLVCENCGTEDSGLITIWNPTGVDQPIPLCRPCSKRIAGTVPEDVEIIRVTEWVKQRDAQKQRESSEPQD